MIVIDGIKYACENCVRGHRATKCTHSERKLVPVKKQGRPSTTCHHCKSLREDKNINPSGSCQCAKIEKEGGLFEIDDTIQDRCFCTIGHRCSCHSKRKKHGLLTNHEGGKHLTKVKKYPSYTPVLTPFPTIDDLSSESAFNIKEEETPSCCMPSIEDVKSSFDPQTKLPDIPDGTTLLDQLIPNCCSSRPIVSNSETSLLPHQVTTEMATFVPKKEKKCCQNFLYQSNSTDILNLLNDNFLDNLYNSTALTNHFVENG